MAKFHVHMQEQYKPNAHGTTITGYTVWAWLGNKLLGKIHGTQRVFSAAAYGGLKSAKRETDKYARNLRALAKS